MKWRDKILKTLELVAIPHLTLILTAGSAIFFVMGLLHPGSLSALPLIPEKIMQGEVWRLVTFIFYPLNMRPIFALFTYYLFYLLGTELEAEWGEAKFTWYVLIACLATGLLASFNPSRPAVNGYLYGTIFLAFAFLHPDFTLSLFFIIPIKVKYLAALEWILYAWTLLTGDWASRLAVLVSNANFFLFFGRAIIANMRSRRHQMQSKLQRIQDERLPFHVCEVCKTTEKSNPRMDFRVCSSCRGGLEYCMDHLDSNTHLLH